MPRKEGVSIDEREGVFPTGESEGDHVESL